MARADAAIFPRELLHDCLTRALKEGATITDEASALEYCGFTLSLLKDALIILK
jgi:2-C-methyl-D-erythritol 4-phosphate cytidylyltransferase